MVGSVLLERMRAERDLEGLEVFFFSTSSAGGAAPSEAASPLLLDAWDIGQLRACDVVLTCQGASYTARAYPALMRSGWGGYWIDAASALRLDPQATLVLDPVNLAQIERRLEAGCRAFVGANCTVSLLLMAVVGLFRAGLVEWISTMTYQAVSGAGSRQLKELAEQIRCLAGPGAAGASRTSLEVDRAVRGAQAAASLPTSEIGAPLACNVLPWIGPATESGQTREEWKASVEATRILGADPPVVIDGICARVDALRCHSQALCIKLVKDVALDRVAELIEGSHPWVRVVEHSREATLRELTPAAVSGSLTVAVGRLRALQLGPSYLGAFTVGDQLLWGAAEPLRRMLAILRRKGV